MPLSSLSRRISWGARISAHLIVRPLGTSMARICEALFKFQRAKALLLFVPVALLSGALTAQNLPPPSRTVFKCAAGGKTVYSDSPCPGAAKLEIEPTRGLNKSSGKELVGTDVNREKNREAFAEAIKPITGMNAKQLDLQGRRMKLTPESQRECRRMDMAIPSLELEERQANNVSIFKIQARLFAARKRFRELRC